MIAIYFMKDTYLPKGQVTVPPTGKPDLESYSTLAS